MTMKAEIRAMQVQTKECRGLPGAVKEAVKRQEGSALESGEEVWPADTFIWDAQSPEL